MSIEKLKVLVVDDDPVFLDVMKRVLESKKCDVICVSDAQVALSLLLNQIFHLVFIDCVLQSCKGTTVVQKIRELLGASVQIIMMSGIVPEKSLSRYIDVGICDFLSKPISDKEIELNLRKVKEKYIYGTQNNILIKLFSPSVSTLQTLKSLTTLKTVRDYEFFFYLSNALATKETLSLKFEFNSKEHKIILDQGNIVDYISNDNEAFIQRLIDKNYINESSLLKLRGLKQEDIVNFLITNCLLSSGQLSDLKYDFLIDTLKDISVGMEISVDFDLYSKPVDNYYVILEQSEYADTVFLFLKQKFNNQLFSLFDDDIMEKHLIFEDKKFSYRPEMESLINELKSGIKLKGIYNRYIDDKNLFCFYITYVLLNGNVYFSEDSMSFKHQYLHERYTKLYHFITNAKTIREVFIKLSGFPGNQQLNHSEMKIILNNFLQHNHPDKVGFELTGSFLKLVNKTIFALRSRYEKENDPNLIREIEENKKKEQIKLEIMLREKKKIIERDIETKQYQKAYSLLKSIPENTLKVELEWQLIYLWFHFKCKEYFKKNKEQVHQFMRIIQEKRRDLQSDKLFQFVLGLFHFNKKNYQQANVYFNQVKKLDPSFQPNYSELKKCSVILLKEKKATQSFMEKLKNFSLTDIKAEFTKTKKTKKAS